MKKLYSFSIALIVLFLMSASASAIPANPNPMISHVNDVEAYAIMSNYDISSGINYCYVDLLKSSNGEGTTLFFAISGYYDNYDRVFWYCYDGPIDDKCVDVVNDYISLEVPQLSTWDSYNYPSEIDLKLTLEKDGEYTSKVNSISTYNDGTTYKENYDISSATLTEVSINGENIDMVPFGKSGEIKKITSVSKS